MKFNRTAALAATLAAALLAAPVQAQEATIRKNLAERVPQFQKIDEVRKTEMPGLYEVRIGTDLLYTDAEGNFLDDSRRSFCRAYMDQFVALVTRMAAPAAG